MAQTDIDPGQLKWAVRVTCGLAVSAVLAQLWYAASSDEVAVGAVALTLVALWFAALMVVMLTAGFRAGWVLLTMPLVFGAAIWTITF